MTYGDPIVRKAVPLALGLVSASNPQLPILDTLSRYSHDNDLEVAVNAILAMGLVGAGTNNARLSQMLRGLAGYYAKEPNCLFMVRIAQGLVHMGKGTIGINPFYNDRTIMSPPAVAGLLSLLVSFTDAKSFVLGNSHWMMYWLVTAMYPQFLITVDEQLQEQAITVRVGQAVNTVGLAGQRMGISGVSCVVWLEICSVKLTPVVVHFSSKLIKHQSESLSANEPSLAPTSTSRMPLCWRAL